MQENQNNKKRSIKKKALKPTVFRFYTREIPGYHYKSQNIVDLLKEVNETKSFEQGMDKQFSPKPFTFSNMVIPGCSGGTVYSPYRSYFDYKKHEICCICVHVCEQFQSYPTTNLGIRIVPDDAPCAFTSKGVCHCSCLAINNKITKKTVPGILIIREHLNDLNIPRR